VAKKLSAIHDLGAMTVLCTDKTGTLTEARIVLTGCVDPAGGDSARVAALAATNSRLASGVRSPLDAAIIAAADAAADGWRLVAEAPFDFERRRASVLVERDGERLIVVKGAPEAVLAASVAVESAAGPASMTEEARRRLLAFLDERASSGLRSLAVATRSASSDVTALGPADERDLVLAGFCFFADPVKASAPAALAKLKALGVRVKILSGDAPAVVAHVAASLGLGAASVLTGDEIARLSDAALSVRARQTDLFARLAPDQKVRVVRALKARGETVGFLGDGLNDAPAIKAADAGLSVVDATDVARAAADLILMEQDLGVLADGVAEGRRSHANILKYVRMATSSNFGNMASMAIASVALPFLPLTPIQVLLNNLLYDVSEAGIPFDDVDKQQVLKPHGWDMRGIRRFTFVMGPLSSVFDLVAFSVLRLVFDLSGAAFQTAWFLESMTTQILVVFVIRTAEPVWSSRPNGLLAAASLGALATAYLLALTPAGAAFGFVAPPAPALLAMLAISAAYLLAAEAMKSFASRPRAARSRRR
jgi:Mg2+-importing ATPase